MSVKRKFVISAVLMLLLSLVLVLLLGAMLAILFALFQPEVHISLTKGLETSELLVQRFLLIWAGVVLTVVFAAGTAIFVWLYRSVVHPLYELEEAMLHLQEGDLSYEFTGSEDREIQRLCQSYEELRRRLQHTVQARLEQENESRMMLANVSHDIKTPVTSIRGYVEGILDGVADTPEKQRKYLKTIGAKANTIELLAENLSLYAKLEMKRMQYRFAVEDVLALLRRTAAEAELDLATNQMRCICELPEGPYFVKMDRDAVRRVFANLITNAIKYKQEGEGVLRLHAQKTEQGALIRFSDTGIGISEADLKHVFEGFYRGDPSRNNKISGNGLGLSICRRIVEDHGGKIWIRSEVGEGTEVILLLPLREEKEEGNGKV